MYFNVLNYLDRRELDRIGGNAYGCIWYASAYITCVVCWPGLFDDKYKPLGQNPATFQRVHNMYHCVQQFHTLKDVGRGNNMLFYLRQATVRICDFSTLSCLYSYSPWFTRLEASMVSLTRTLKPSCFTSILHRICSHSIHQIFLP